MKKLLSNGSLRNKRLRESKSSQLIKTAVHRFHYDGADDFRDWYYELLTDRERKQVSEKLDYIPKRKEYTKRDAEQVKQYLKNCGVVVDIIGSVARDGRSFNDMDFLVRNHENTPAFQKRLRLIFENATFVKTDWDGLFFAKTFFGTLDFFFDVSEFDF